MSTNEQQPQGGHKFVIKQLIRDVQQGKVTKENFDEILRAHYENKARDDTWIAARIKRLWRATGK